jgi:hypothetical protein
MVTRSDATLYRVDNQKEDVMDLREVRGLGVPLAEESLWRPAWLMTK